MGYRYAAAIAVFAVLPSFAGASANDVAQECIEVSAIWGETEDVSSACACIGDAAAGDDALVVEFMGFRDAYSSNTEAYEGASSAAKAIMDQCT
ncbi:MAG: hypothetical protein AAGL49_10185 [Pseudomonadota bacterium]